MNAPSPVAARPHRRLRLAELVTSALLDDSADVRWACGVQSRVGPAFAWLHEGAWTIIVAAEEEHLGPPDITVAAYPGYRLSDPSGAASRASATLVEVTASPDPTRHTRNDRLQSRRR